MFDLKLAVRSNEPLQPLLTTTLTDLIGAINANELLLVENTEGKEFVQVINTATNKRFSIGVSTKAHQADNLKDLFARNVIYCGQTDNGYWFSLSREAVSNTPKMRISVADLLKGVKTEAPKVSNDGVRVP